MTKQWTETLAKLQTSFEEAEKARADLARWEGQTAAEIEKYLRVDGGLEVDIDAIKATVTRPYTILPINEHEAWLIHWRGVKMPILGWVVAQEPAFVKARVSRSMDLITPLPGWMRAELGWQKPAHSAVISGDRTSIEVTEGEEGTFRRKYGKFLGTRQADGTFKLKGGDAWIKLVAALVRDGILPYKSQPVADENRVMSAVIPSPLNTIIEKKEIQARSGYIHRAADEFFRTGAVLINYPPGAGKTLVTCLILNSYRGRVLILADSRLLIDQWADRVQALVQPGSADVTLSTYQGASKYLDEEWDLIVFDEAQRLPANTFSKLAFAKTKNRISLSGTPWREDDRQFLIVALSGFPVAIRWAEFLRSGAMRKPKITVVTVANDAAKTGYVKYLLSKRRGRTLIFCDWIEQGQALADSIDVPFVHGGGSARKLQVIQENEVVVVSRIADRGISHSDLRMVIEVAGQGSAREQFAQRVGRLLHGEFEGDFYTIFTPEEAAKYRGRIFGVEAELAGEVDIEFLDMTGGKIADPAARAPKQARVKERVVKPSDKVGKILASKPIQRIILDAEKMTGPSRRGYMEKAFRLLWDGHGNLYQLRLRKGMSQESFKPFRSGLNRLVSVGLAKRVGDHYYLNLTRVKELVP